MPDVQGVEWAVECKEYKKIQLLAKDMEQAADNAKGRPWVLCIKNKPGKGIKAIRVAVIEYETFVNLYRRAYDL